MAWAAVERIQDFVSKGDRRVEFEVCLVTRLRIRLDQKDCHGEDAVSLVGNVVGVFDNVRNEGVGDVHRTKDGSGEIFI